MLSRNAGPPGIITYAVLFVIALGANVSLWTAAIRRGSIGVGEVVVGLILIAILVKLLQSIFGRIKKRQ